MAEVSPQQRVINHLRAHPNRVAEICQALVRFDTVFLGPGAEPRQELECQRWVASFLTNLGFEVDQWEPDPDALGNHPMYQHGLNWTSRPITVGTLRGTGGGKSLILNGHIDTVSAEPISRWKYNPWAGDIVGRRLYGRGACDMKGGIAVCLAVAEAIVEAGVSLRGDLLMQTVTDEETTGMGTIAAIQRGYRADACLVPEPSAFETWVAYRGILYGTIRVRGRSAHGEIPQPHWREGGGVNAIDAMRKVLTYLDALNEEWRGRNDKSHRFLATPSIVVTGIHGGEFIASVPADCQVDLDITYLPGNVDSQGYGNNVRREIVEHVRLSATSDPWLREHLPEFTWIQDYPASEMDPDNAFVRSVREASDVEGVMSRLGGLDSWADAASYIRAGVPSVCFGPGNSVRAHTIDEWVSIDELETCARVVARLTTSWCGSE